MKAQTCLSEASFCGLGKRERFLVEEMQSSLTNQYEKEIINPKQSIMKFKKPSSDRIGNLIITIFTAIVSTFFMQSCM